MAISTVYLVLKRKSQIQNKNIQNIQNDCAYTFSSLPLHRDTETPNTNHTTDSKAMDKDTYITQHVHTVESNLTPMVMHRL